MKAYRMTGWLKKGLLALLLLRGFAGFAQQAPSDIGNFYPFLDAYSQKHQPGLSYLAKDWRNVEKWRASAKAKLHELLAFQPDPAPLDAEVLSTTKRAGYTQYLVRYRVNALQSPCTTTAAFILSARKNTPSPTTSRRCCGSISRVCTRAAPTAMSWPNGALWCCAPTRFISGPRK
jgi:hypothetical protein